MIEMAVSEKDIAFANRWIFDKLVSKRAQTGATVKNDNVLAASNLDARCVSAIANGFGSRTGDAPSDYPKPNAHSRSPVLRNYLPCLTHGFEPINNVLRARQTRHC